MMENEVERDAASPARATHFVVAYLNAKIDQTNTT